MLHVSPRIQIPDDELDFQYVRSGGPGGQNVNKVSSKAVLRWSPGRSAALPDDVRQRFLTRYAGRLTAAGELLITSQRSRDQRRNADDCLEKLAALIQAVLVAPKKRRATRPTAASRQRRLDEKKRDSAKKQARRRETFRGE